MNIIKAVLMIFLTLILVACGGSDNAALDQATEEAPTAFPTFAFNAPTEAPAVATAAALVATQTVEAGGDVDLDPVAIERGLGRYEALECVSCHGETGQGTDRGPSLLAYTLPQDEFISYMRSGGDLGDDHRFPTERLSNSGIANLYQYIVSLTQQAG